MNAEAQLVQGEVSSELSPLPQLHFFDPGLPAADLQALSKRSYYL